MSEDLQNEIQAINSIYSPDTLFAESSPSGTDSTRSSADTYILKLPNQSVAVRLHFTNDYPQSPPTVLGTQHVGGKMSKGTGTRVTEIVREVLAKVFREGEVCLFDLLEEVGILFNSETDATTEAEAQTVAGNRGVREDTRSFSTQQSLGRDPGESTEQQQLGDHPPWTVSEVVTEKKSVFIARVASVSAPSQARQYLHHLLCTDKKAAKATHNITAWRIRREGNTTFQDCDDDGETAAGGRLLHLMQVMDLWDVMVVVTRWYGGIQLGPDRFRIINSVARDAFVRGGFVSDERDRTGVAKKKGKR